jgi:hypothetical protein
MRSQQYFLSFKEAKEAGIFRNATEGRCLAEGFPAGRDLAVVSEYDDEAF